MTGFNHGMTGAVIALSIKNPLLAIPLSFISHYLCDAIPHFGVKLKQVYTKKFNNYLALDFIFAILLMVILGLMFPDKIWLIWNCMIAAAIPDIVWLYYLKIKHASPPEMDFLNRWHTKVNHHINHVYFDSLWFGLMWLIILLIRY